MTLCNTHHHSVAVDIKGYYKVPKNNETAMALALSQGVRDVMCVYQQ